MNFNRLLKETIAQSSAHAIRKPVAAVRHEIAALKGQVSALRRTVRALQKTVKVAAPATRSAVETTANAEGVRIRATGPMVRRLRQKLGLTQAEFAKLAEVSALTVWKWERAPGRIMLRSRTSQRLLAVRGMGKRQAKAALA